MFCCCATITDAVTPRIVRVPIAPAEGLVLLSSSFGGKLHTVSLHVDPNTALAKERKDLMHRILLNRQEDEEMTRFREEVIYKEVSSNWGTEVQSDRWRAYLERCYESNKDHDEDELSDVLYELDQAKLRSENKSQCIVEQNRIDLTENGRQGALLPKQFTTKLCVRYSVAPGIFTSDLRRAVTRVSVPQGSSCMFFLLGVFLTLDVLFCSLLLLVVASQDREDSA